jgi:hypothetical protein
VRPSRLETPIQRGGDGDDVLQVPQAGAGGSRDDDVGVVDVRIL